MNSLILNALRGQFLYHVWNCKKCRKNGLLPDHICSIAYDSYTHIQIFSDIEEDYRKNKEGINLEKEAENKQMISPLFNFWPGTN